MPAVAPGPLCALGRCQCSPACPAQLARVSERLEKIRAHLAPPDALAVVLVDEAPKGMAYLCLACAVIQPGPGNHCGYRVALVETRDLEKDEKTGRVAERYREFVAGQSAK